MRGMLEVVSERYILFKEKPSVTTNNKKISEKIAIECVNNDTFIS